MAEKGDLLAKCEKYIQKGKADKFYDDIMEKDLGVEFVNQAWLSTFRGLPSKNAKYNKEHWDIANFALKVSMKGLTEKYGEKLTNRFVQMMYEMPTPRERNFALYDLVHAKTKPLTEQEANYVEEILNFAETKEHVVGMHVIGAEIGKDIMEEGILLTGHKFVTRELGKTNIKGTLEKNIRFFEDGPIEFVRYIIDGRGYNSPTGKFNDMVMVAIPKKDLEQNKQGIILENKGEKYLNPDYISGFVRVDVKNGSLQGFHQKQKTESIAKPESVEEFNYQDWKEKFKRLV